MGRDRLTLTIDQAGRWVVPCHCHAGPVGRWKPNVRIGLATSGHVSSPRHFVKCDEGERHQWPQSAAVSLQMVEEVPDEQHGDEADHQPRNRGRDSIVPSALGRVAVTTMNPMAG
jgi:hypothetical protein